MTRDVDNSVISFTESNAHSIYLTEAKSSTI